MGNEMPNSCPLVEHEAPPSMLDMGNCSLTSDHLKAQKCGLPTLKTYNSVGFGFHVGDMVWGKVKSHPWWPGHIFNETFASSSVRRTKREGHVLVAFFGDSSYGWFEPAELVHFDANFSEKSRQTTAKNFVKAVEEAVDEASRRAALGLICRCRNPYNFRSINITGYFAVDVPDYDVGIYSSSQIIQARELFQPEETLTFIKSMALMAYGGSRSLEWIKHKATVLIYRKTVFEEFDETYAQAFGMQPERPSHELTGTMDPSLRGSSRAPLSGSMVFADALGGGEKGPAKSAKAKGNPKKDWYLFKRRDEPTDSIKNADEPAADDMLHEKNAATLSLFSQPERNRPPVDAIHSTPSLHHPTDENASHFGTPLPFHSAPFRHDPTEEKSSNIGTPLPPQGDEFFVSEPVLPPSVPDNGALSTKPEEAAHIQSNDGGGALDFSSMAAEVEPEGIVMSRSKGSKHRNDGQSCLKGTPPEKRKKSEEEMSPENGNDSRGQKPDRVDYEVPPRSTGLPPENTDTVRSDPSKLLLDLKSLALDPFYDMGRNCQLLVANLVLGFRSAVYQKSLVSSPPIEKELPPQPDTKPAAATPAIAPPAGRQKVPEFRSSDPTKSGRKRGLSEDNQEKAAAAKKTKKLNDPKQLAAERKAKQRPRYTPPEVDQLPPERPLPPVVGAEDPAILVIKFPAQTALPSIGELKAKFARFGQLDSTETRVFWKTNTCRVVFRRRADALAAHRHAAGHTLFGNVSVKYQLREAAGRDHHQSKMDPAKHQPVQLKSCLKKPAVGEEVGAAARGVARVRFLLEADAGDRPAAGGWCNSGGGGGMFQSENWDYNSVVEKEHQNVDISMQMFTLLTRCSEIVSSLKSFLGYVPYRPL